MDRYVVIQTYGTKELHTWSQMNSIQKGMNRGYGSPVRPAIDRDLTFWAIDFVSGMFTPVVYGWWLLYLLSSYYCYYLGWAPLKCPVMSNAWPKHATNTYNFGDSARFRPSKFGDSSVKNGESLKIYVYKYNYYIQRKKWWIHETMYTSVHICVCIYIYTVSIFKWLHNCTYLHIYIQKNIHIYLHIYIYICK